MPTYETGTNELPVGHKRLWIGVLLAPAAWLLLEVVGYWFAARSCELSVGGVPMAGTAHPAVTHSVLSLAALVAAGAGLAVALGNWRAVRPHTEREGAPSWGRARFMSYGGVLLSVLFGGGIVLFGLPAFLVNACSQAR